MQQSAQTFRPFVTPQLTTSNLPISDTGSNFIAESNEAENPVISIPIFFFPFLMPSLSDRKLKCRWPQDSSESGMNCFKSNHDIVRGWMDG